MIYIVIFIAFMLLLNGKFIHFAFVVFCYHWLNWVGVLIMYPLTVLILALWQSQQVHADYMATLTPDQRKKWI